MEENSRTYVEDDEITLKELILKVKEFWKELLKFKFHILIISLLGGGLFFLQRYFVPRTYTAELTFMVNEDEGRVGVGNVLGRLGLRGIGGSGSELNLDKILELSKSRRIIYPTLLDTVKDGSDLFLVANKIIDVYGFHEKWNKSNSSEMHNFLFAERDLDLTSLSGQRAIKRIYTKVVGNAKQNNQPLLSCEYGPGTGILSIKVKSESELLSSHLSQSIYENLSEYYITKAIEPQAETVMALSKRTDSLRLALSQAEIQLANYDDSNQSLFTQRDRIRRARLQREVSILNIMYGEAVKNLETANFTLQNKTPFFQIIDPPVSPLDPSARGFLRSTIIGFLLGGFFACLFFVLRKIYLDTMSS